MPLVTYKPSLQMDMVLSKLYTDIIYAGDGDSLLMPEARMLSGFLKNCQLPNVCLLGYDEGEMAQYNGPWLWALFEPCFSGAFVALWIKPEKRGTKQSVRFTFELLEAALTTCPLLLGITRQKALVAEHQKMGYQLIGLLPGLWEGHDVWLLTLDREGLQDAKRPFANLWAPVVEAPAPSLEEEQTEGSQP